MDECTFDHTTFLDAFAADLKRAVNSVFIQSPYLTANGVQRLNAKLKEVADRGVQVCVFVQEPHYWHSRNIDAEERAQIELSIARLQQSGLHVTLRKGIHQKAAVIDSSILWRGSLNILSYNPKSTSEEMTRTPNAFRALSTIALLSLDACPACFDRQRNVNTSDIALNTDTIGNVLLRERKNKGLSQQDLANRTGVNRKQLGTIETGQHLPPIGTLTKIMDALDLGLAVVPAHVLPFVADIVRVFPNRVRSKTAVSTGTGLRTKTTRQSKSKAKLQSFEPPREPKTQVTSKEPDKAQQLDKPHLEQARTSR